MTLDVIGRKALLQPYMVACDNCKMVFRVENVTPFTVSERKYHCAACGSSDTSVKSDYANDKWISMAESFGLSRSLENSILMQKLYNLWDPDEYPWFKDFVKVFLVQAKLIKATDTNKSSIGALTEGQIFDNATDGKAIRV